jgi:hypothetical protein
MIKNHPSSTTVTRYKVDAIRIKPDVDTFEGYGHIGFGVLYVLLSLCFCYQFVGGLINEFVSIRSISDIHLFNICAGLLGVPFTLATGIGSIYIISTGVPIFIRNREWMRHTTKARATIIDRQKEQIITSDDYKYGGYTMSYALILKVNDRPEVPELDGRLIRANVSEQIFKRCTRKSSVIIYYATHSPLTFILWGE